MISEPVTLEITFNSTVEKVWKALTDKNQLRKWYFNVSDFKPKVNFEFTFKVRNEDRTFTHICKITEATGYKKLVYSWKYEGVIGESQVSFELFPGGATTRLKLIHSGIETFVSKTSDFTRENFLNGWTKILGKSLQEFLISANTE